MEMTPEAVRAGMVAARYVTSARVGLSQEALDDQPLAGSLFAFTPGVCGAPGERFGG